MLDVLGTLATWLGSAGLVLITVLLLFLVYLWLSVSLTMWYVGVFIDRYLIRQTLRNARLGNLRFLLHCLHWRKALECAGKTVKIINDHQGRTGTEIDFTGLIPKIIRQPLVKQGQTQ